MRVTHKTKSLALAVAGTMLSTLMGIAGAVAQSVEVAHKLEKIEVTGSNIKQLNAESPSPIHVISRDDIQKSGSNSVAELLRDISFVSGGSLNDFNAGNNFARGSQSVSLRGLGSVGTLVLVNSRRIALAPVADPNAGQGAIFDLNVIPVGAIERIEILKDGASAIYGSDAIAGVINVILRKDYNGSEVMYASRQNHNSDFRSQTIAATFGLGNLARDRFSMLAAMEYFKRDPTSIYDAKDVQTELYTRLNNRLTPNSVLSDPANRRREAVSGNGAFTVALPLDPRCPPALTFGTLCRYNTFDDTNAEAKTERKSLFVRAAIEISPTLSAFGELRFTRATSQFIGAPPSLDAGSPATWFNAAGQRFTYTLSLPVGHPDNPNAFRLGLRYRFTDLGRTFQNVGNDAASVVVGLNGNWQRWDWETAFNSAQIRREDSTNGQLFFPALQAAVTNGTYRFSGSNSPAMLATLSPYKVQRGKSRIADWNLKGSIELATLAGGSLALATGLVLRTEDFDIASDPRTVAGEFVGAASSTVNGSRKVASVFGELSIPFARSVEMQLAGRYDHYSDYGNSTTPKVGIKWMPTQQLGLRATYAEAFRAPSLLQISSGNVQAVNVGINDPFRCGKAGANADDCSAANGGTGRTISTLITPNPGLQPERSRSYTIGLIYSGNAYPAVHGFSASLDFFNIERRNFIDRFTSTNVITNEFNPNFAGGLVVRDPNPATWLPSVPNSGPIQSTIRRFDNFGEAIVRGFDADMTTTIQLGHMGRLKFNAQGTYLTKSALSQSKGGPLINGLGNNVGFETPRVRGTASLTWDYHDISLRTRYNYTSKWFFGDPLNGCLSTPTTTAAVGNCEVAAYSTIDAGLTYTGIDAMTFSVMARNITGRAAPYDPGQTTLGFNPTFHSPQGVNYVLSVAYRFK